MNAAVNDGNETDAVEAGVVALELAEAVTVAEAEGTSWPSSSPVAVAGNKNDAKITAHTIANFTRAPSRRPSR